MLKKLLAIIFILIAVKSVNANSAAADTSLKRLAKLYELKAYFINQSAKEHIPASEKATYSAKIESLDKEIQQYYTEKRNVIVQSGNANELKKFSTDSMQREDEIALSRENEPMIYAYEMGSHLFGFYVSYINQDKYSPPVSLFYEKSLTKNISVGGFAGYFIEKNILAQPLVSEINYYKLSWENYKYNYWTFGVRGSYHFFNPENPILGLNANNWDLYVTGMAGFSMVSNPKPALENGVYLNPPTKDGLTAGAFLGLRYMYDERLGFFAEGGYSKTSFVNLGANYKFFRFMKKKEEKKSSSKSKSKSSSKGKSSSKTPAKKAPVKKAPVKKK